MITASNGRKPYASSAENEKRDDRSQHCRYPQRNAKQQIKAERRPEKLGQIRRHRHDLHDSPHYPHHRGRKLITAVLGEVVSAGDAQLRRQRLQQHRHQIAGDDDPQQSVAKLRATLDVGGEIARIDVGNAGNERRSHERQYLLQAPLPATALQDQLSARDNFGVAVFATSFHQ